MEQKLKLGRITLNPKDLIPGKLYTITAGGTTGIVCIERKTERTVKYFWVHDPDYMQIDTIDYACYYFEEIGDN